MNPGAPKYFEDLFFSKQKISTGSVTEYYNEVSGGKISIAGDVKGPFELPGTIEYYAHDRHGKNRQRDDQGITRSIQTMGDHTLNLVDAAGIDLKKYDEKGRANGYVDAFVIVHAGEEARIPGTSMISGLAKPPSQATTLVGLGYHRQGSSHS